MKGAVTHSDNGPRHRSKFFRAGRYPVSAFMLIRPIRMLIVVGVRLGEEAVKLEEALLRKFRPKLSRAAMVDRDWALFSIPLM